MASIIEMWEEFQRNAPTLEKFPEPIRKVSRTAFYMGALMMLRELAAAAHDPQRARDLLEELNGYFRAVEQTLKARKQ